MKTWLEDCKCGKKHKVTIKPCPECNVYNIVLPVSNKIQEDCYWNAKCDGCRDYEEHLR